MKSLMQFLKIIIGIDVSKDDLHVCVAGVDAERTMKIIRQSPFKNTSAGHQSLIRYVLKLQLSQPLLFVMEATGVYYESLAYYLHDQKQQVSVLLPTKTKHFAKSLPQKSKTDKIDALMLCRLGCERTLPLWQPASAIMQQLRRLTREHDSFKKIAGMFKSQLHAYEHSHQPLKSSIKRINKQLRLIEQQVEEIERRIKEVLQEDPMLHQRVKKIEKVPGIAMMSIVTVLAETNAFALITNAKQLTSYSGLDVKFQQSGIKKGKTTISKQGNSHIRGALFPPAMSAIGCNAAMKNFYHRIMQNHTCGTVGIVAVERKLLELIYSLWKSGQQYDPNKWKKTVAPPVAELHGMN